MLLVGEDTEDISVGHAYFFVGWKKGRKPLPNCCSTCIFRQLFKQHLAMFMLHRTMHVVLVTRPHGEDKNATNTNLVGSSNKGVIQQAYSPYQESSKDVFVGLLFALALCFQHCRKRCKRKIKTMPRMTRARCTPTSVAVRRFVYILKRLVPRCSKKTLTFCLPCVFCIGQCFRTPNHWHWTEQITLPQNQSWDRHEGSMATEATQPACS